MWKNVQYTAYYDNDAHVVLAKRNIGASDWTIHRTELIGNPFDAHNAVVLAADASDTLHIMWNHHNSELSYVRTTGFGSLEVTGRQKRTEFSNLPSPTLRCAVSLTAACCLFTAAAHPAMVTL